MKRFMVRSLTRVAAVAALPVALLVASAPAGAQWSSQQPTTGSQRYPQQRYPQQGYPQQGQVGSQELFEWSGRVDKEIRVQMSGSRASVMQVGNNERNTGRVRAFAAIPRGDGAVSVQVLEGRGRVDVVQQPTSNNGYTAIVRVRDPDSGAGTYRIAAYWQGTAYNGYGRGRGNGNGNGNGRRGYP